MIKNARASHPLTTADVRDALRLGLQDFARAPLFGLFFGGIYAAAGFLLFLLLAYYRSIWLILPLAIGFPLVGPFVAAGLYEVSRRLGRGEHLGWGEVLTVTIRQSRRELGWMAFVTLFIFWIWMYQVRLLVALFMGFRGFANLDSFLAALTQSNGVALLLVGSAVGAALAFVLFCSTVVAIPMLLHRDVDFDLSCFTASISWIGAGVTGAGPCDLAHLCKVAPPRRAADLRRDTDRSDLLSLASAPPQPHARALGRLTRRPLESKAGNQTKKPRHSAGA
jgi:uncharacterized membrane protein